MTLDRAMRKGLLTLIVVGVLSSASALANIQLPDDGTAPRIGLVL